MCPSVGSFEEVLAGGGDSLNPSDDCAWKAGKLDIYTYVDMFYL